MTTDAGMRLATAPPEALRRAAEAAVRNDPDVSPVALFGSLVAAVAASRPGLADVLETLAADIRVQGRRANV